MERRVARQNGWSHEQRSVYKPKAERSKGGKGDKGKPQLLAEPPWRTGGGKQREGGSHVMTKPEVGQTTGRTCGHS